MKNTQTNPFLTYQVDVFTPQKGVLIDAQPAIKVFKIPDVFILSEFTHGELLLFFYIINNVGKDKDYIKLKIDDIAKQSNKSRRTINYAIKGLVAKEFIQKQEGKQSSYWINPYIVFRGNRVKYFEDVKPELVNKIYKKKVA